MRDDVRAVVECLDRRQLLAAHIVGNPTAFSTIQAAVDAAAPGSVINVDPGVYSELVVVFKTLTLRGPQAGVDARSNVRMNPANEAVVNGNLNLSGTRSTSFYLNADNIVLDGFTVEGQTAIGTYGAGIHMGAAKEGIQVLNNIVQNNATGLHISNDSPTNPLIVRRNLFRNNNVDGPHTGRAVYSDGSITGGTLTNVVIDQNAFVRNLGQPSFAVQPAIGLEAGTSSVQSNIQITNNIFDRNGKHLLAFNASGITITGNVFQEANDTTSAGLRFEGGLSNVTIQNNNIYGSGARAIRIDKKASPLDNSNFTITGNNIWRNGTDSGADDAGLYVNAGQYTGTLDATNNWWGASSGPSGDGPGSGDAVIANGNSVNFTPFATAPVREQQGPWWGTPSQVGAVIQFEDYDHGGQGVAYHDSTSDNIDDDYHAYEGVDIDRNPSDPNDFYLTNVRASEWLEYTVDIPVTGLYTLTSRVANNVTGGQFRLEVDGVNVSGAIAVPNTGDLTSFTSVVTPNVNLSAGVRVLRVFMQTNGSGGNVGNFNWFHLSPPSGPVAPLPPSNLVATGYSSSRIDLSWTDNANNETGFILERSGDGVGDWTQVATPAANATTYNDTSATLVAGVTYFYRLRATNDGIDSAHSNVASAATLPPGYALWVPGGSSWNYLDNGSNQGTAWRGIGFDDSAWSSGRGQFGYGDGDETTIVSFGPDPNNKFITTYFRKTFEVEDPSRVIRLDLRMVRDDGAVVYINGTEVWRSNMPAGTITHTTPASSALGSAEENIVHGIAVGGEMLVPGANAVAVEVHQSDGDSSDLSFDFGILGWMASPVAPPSAVRATAAAHDRVNLSWIDSAEDESGFKIERSTDGINFSQIGTAPADASGYSDTTAAAETQYWYRVRAYDNAGDSFSSSVATATTPAAPLTLPAPWTNADVGAVAAAGSASYSNGTFTVTGSGNDIWFNADEFHFVSQPWTGNGTIIARIAGLQNTNANAKAALMFRESAAAGSRHATLTVTPGNGVVLFRRTTTNGASDGFFTGGSAPIWLKLVRNGDVFTGQTSADGATWTTFATATVAMNAGVLLGLGVTSKNDGVLTTAVFDSVSVTTLAAGAGPAAEAGSVEAGAVEAKYVQKPKNRGQAMKLKRQQLDLLA